MPLYRLTGNFLDLESPTSVVPLLGGSNTIYLVLTESAAPPVVPIGQAREFIQKSRSDMYDDYVYNSPKVRSTKTAASGNKGSTKVSSTREKSNNGSQRAKYDYREAIETERINPIQRENFSSVGNGDKYSDMDNEHNDEYRRRRMDWDRQEREARSRERDGTGRGVDSMNKVFDSAAEVGSHLADAAGDAAAAAASTGTVFVTSALAQLDGFLRFVYS